CARHEYDYEGGFDYW
nr:immunoglobulin heavy chain junction region [Mus musculus]MBK4197477.1 immunoglobulin heavy chain junction region [Mus musculus]MBK4197478.1 immunoglobulin heavy chain junction region [Mus musculus]